MTAWITALLQDAISSPLTYALLLSFAALDAFLPVIPSESLVITAGVFAAADGEPSLAAVIASAGLGAFVGDHVSYFIGRRAGGRLLRGAGPESRRSTRLHAARRLLERRGGGLLLVCRYIPGARTATTLTAGAVGYPLRTFMLFDALAALSWGAYCALVGYIGGAAFEDAPLKGLALGLGLSLLLAATVEAARRVRRRSVTR